MFGSLKDKAEVPPQKRHIRYFTSVPFFVSVLREGGSFAELLLFCLGFKPFLARTKRVGRQEERVLGQSFASSCGCPFAKGFAVPQTVQPTPFQKKYKKHNREAATKRVL
jgi:hypothetical protein